MARAGSPLRTRGALLRRRAHQLGSGGPYPVNLLARAAHRWVASTYQGNGPWVSDGGLVAWKGAAGQAAVTPIGLALPGSTGNYASTPNSAALNPVGVITVTALVEDVTIGASQIITGKFTSVGAQRGWQLGLAASGKLTFQWSTTGADTLTHTQPAAAFTKRYVKAAFDPSVGTTDFAESDDGLAWSSLGQAGPTGATSVFACTADLIVSGRNDGAADQFGPGVIGSVLVEDDGVAVASPDFAAAAPGVLTLTDDQTNVWTINQTANGSDDPTMEPTPDGAHVSFPLTASNTLSTPKQGGWTTVEWEVFFTDDTSETGTTTADPVVVGGTAVTKSDVERVELHDGVGGAVVADLDIARDFDGDHKAITSTATGEVWTVNRSTVAVGYRTSIVTAAKSRYGGAQEFRLTPPPWLGAADQSFTLAVPFRSFSQPSGVAHLVDHSQLDGRLSIYFDATTNRVFCVEKDEMTQIHQVTTAASVHDGRLHVLVLRREYGVEWAMLIDGKAVKETDFDSLGPIDFGSVPLFVGAADSGVQFFNGENLTPPLFYDSALTDDEADALCQQMGAGT